MRIFIAVAVYAGTALWLMGANASQFLEGRVNNRGEGMESPAISRLAEHEAKLDGLFQLLSLNLDEMGRTKLSASQTAWAAYSKAECDYTANASPVEPLHPVSYNDCLLGMTVERGAELGHQLQWLELLNSGLSQKL